MITRAFDQSPMTEAVLYKVLIQVPGLWGCGLLLGCRLLAPCGAVAQLGERRVRNAEVGSSILLGSTN